VSDGRTVKVRPLLELVSQDLVPTTLPHFALFLMRDKVAALGVDAYTLRRSHSLTRFRTAALSPSESVTHRCGQLYAKPSNAL
jgi:hypothetical protein